MKVVGLVTVREEQDIWPREITMCDHLYVCDSTGHPVCDRDGVRGELLERAYRDHGHDILVCLVHADEVWRCDPREIAARSPHADGWMFLLPLCFQPGPWDDRQGALEQMTSRLEPGWLEFRMFRGGPDVRYEPGQHFNVAPRGLRHVVGLQDRIDHYPFRSPASQLARATATWDPDNYRDCPLDGDGIKRKFLGRSGAYTQLVVA